MGACLQNFHPATRRQRSPMWADERHPRGCGERLFKVWVFPAKLHVYILHLTPRYFSFYSRSLFISRYGALGALEDGPLLPCSCAKHAPPQLPSTQYMHAYLNPRNTDVNHLKNGILRKEQGALQSVGQIRLKSRLCPFPVSFAGKCLLAS